MKKTNIKSQEGRILRHLKKGWKITPMYALNHFNCFRLASRIADLRKKGYKIVTNMITRNGKRFAQYILG